jgi:pyruvate/2-oxoglutarate/acetoin dehydrogenase E1 component
VKYYDEVLRGTLLLAAHPQVVFIGQSVCYQGHALSRTLRDVPAEKKIELPVFEETQMGLSIGLALEGYLPVSIYPRFNFLLMAAGQLVNHLDKIPGISKGEWKPKVIIKTMVGSERPLYPGVQHVGNFAAAYRELLDWVVVEDLTEPGQVYPAYERALARDGATLLIEHGDFYTEK